jgi:hypothetical protein
MGFGAFFANTKEYVPKEKELCKGTKESLIRKIVAFYETAFLHLKRAVEMFKLAFSEPICPSCCRWLAGGRMSNLARRAFILGLARPV